MIILKVQTGFPEPDREVIEKALFDASIKCTTRVEDEYIHVGLRDNTDAAIARYHLRMNSYTVV